MDENLAPLSQEDNLRSCKMNDNLEKWILFPWIMDEHVGTDIGKWMKSYWSTTQQWFPPPLDLWSNFIGEDPKKDIIIIGHNV